ncbi:unnamed protein product [Durusdinium trenchii]|uniref:DNA ligase (Polydeoxyribonucleotide synthase [NAD(+)]) n=2 Tax=Durusdinium trenchii TaxID=1381693 RepID=A0ABP0Q446_9DINO
MNAFRQAYLCRLRYATRAATSTAFRLPAVQAGLSQEARPAQGMKLTRATGSPPPSASPASPPLADGKVLMKVGKYRGKAFADIYSEDPQYCQWVCKAALTTDSSGDSLKIFAAYVQHRWLLSLQNLVSQAKANSLLGQQLVVTGEPTELTRSTLEGLIRILGGKVTSKISEATAIVVAGSKQWNGEPVSESTKMQQAIARDIPLLTVDDFQAWVQKISTSKSSGQSKGKQRGKVSKVSK